MQELISPQQSEQLILLAAGVLLVGGAIWGVKVLGGRGVLAGLIGPLIFGLWQFHKWITRYDPQTEYFGLDKVWVLLLEIVLFVALGAAAGIVWKKFISRRDAEFAEKI
jgi:hypothetical protein